MPSLPGMVGDTAPSRWREAATACLFALLAAPACAVLAVLVAACEGPDPEPLE